MFKGASGPTRLLLRVALYGALVFVGVPLAFSHVMTQGFRARSLSPPPPGWELGHVTSEGLRLRTWLHPGDPDRPSIVIVHGLGDSLESYLGHARPLVQRGHTVLLVDLRAHGGSEGERTTLGGRERADVRAAMDELENRHLAERGIVLMGHSMGAVAVLLAAADAPDGLVRAVIVEAPYDTYRNNIEHHALLLYHLPRWVPIIPAGDHGRGVAGRLRRG